MTKQILLRVPADVAERLTEAADRNGVSRNVLIADVLGGWLDGEYATHERTAIAAAAAKAAAAAVFAAMGGE
jgi:phosphopantothenate synthetase